MCLTQNSLLLEMGTLVLSVPQTRIDAFQPWDAEAGECKLQANTYYIWGSCFTKQTNKQTSSLVSFVIWIPWSLKIQWK